MKLTREEILSRVGDLSQVAGIRLMQLAGGNEEGVRIADVRTGSGLRFQVTLDRGMDLSLAEYKGAPLAVRSDRGDVHPRLYGAAGDAWRGSFAGGLMTGCGLNSVGSPSLDAGEDLPQHGLISQTMAASVSVSGEWTGDEYTMSLRGIMREEIPSGGFLELRRTVSVALGGSDITLADEVHNLTGRRTPLMILYHINAGWPIVDCGTRMFLNVRSTTPRDGAAVSGIPDARIFSAPMPGAEEQVFYHDLAANTDGFAAALLANEKQQLGLYVRYRQKELPRYVEWKLMRSGMYVVGMEPGNCLVGGRAAERAAGTLQFLEPGETRRFLVHIGVLDSVQSIDDFKEAYGLQ